MSAAEEQMRTVGQKDTDRPRRRPGQSFLAASTVPVMEDHRNENERVFEGVFLAGDFQFSLNSTSARRMALASFRVSALLLVVAR